MYAIVECGGRQYRAEEGHSFSVEKLPQEVGEQIELDNVLLLSNDGDIAIGQPAVEGATVLATVTDQYRGKKIFVWKYKPKKRYRRRRGHRQYYTRLRIDSIVVGGSDALTAARAKAAEKRAAEEAAAAQAAEEKAAAKAAADAKAAEEKEAARIEAAEKKAAEEKAQKEAAIPTAAAEAQPSDEPMPQAPVQAEPIVETDIAGTAAIVDDSPVLDEEVVQAAIEVAPEVAEPTVIADVEDKTMLFEADENLLPSDADLGLELDTDDKTLLLEADDDLAPSDDELMGFMESASAAEGSDKTLIMEPDSDLVPDELEMAALAADDGAGFTDEGTVMLDDLTLIEGIGPKIQEALQTAGILTMAELSITSEERLHEIVKEAGISAHPETWPEQARIAGTGDMDALKAYQDTLDGGVAH